jgi:hypothetical protein
MPASILGLRLHSKGEVIRDQEAATESLGHLELTVARAIEERVAKGPQFLLYAIM